MKFHSGEIAVQERAGVRDIAEDVGEGIADHLPPGASEFLERRQMAVLGTIDSRDNVWASVVTGDPGFIETVDDRTLKIAARNIVERSVIPQSRKPRATSHYSRRISFPPAACASTAAASSRMAQSSSLPTRFTPTAGATCRSEYLSAAGKLQ